MSDESLSFIAPNFENVPAKLQGISFEKSAFRQRAMENGIVSFALNA
jgi:hypothetical protein